MKISLIQMNSNDDKSCNLREAERLVRSACEADNPRLVVLPECYDYLGGTQKGAFAAGEEFPTGPSYQLMSGLARELSVYIHAGSVMELEGDKRYNSTVVFDPTGREIARYRKIHMFDIKTPDGMIYKESDLYSAGKEIVTYQVDGVTVGCSICYDIRFPELYAKLVKAGVQVIAIPAAFTLQTGKDHWEVLCRSRAIETQCYVLASNMVGSYLDGDERRENYGNSMIVGPWGSVLSRAENRVGYVTATIDLKYVELVRQNVPVQHHRVL